MNNSSKIGVLSLLALFTLNSCGELYNVTNRCTSSHVNPDWGALERNLSSAEALWAAKKPSSFYRYLYNATGFTARQNIYVSVLGSNTIVFRDDLTVPEAEAKYYGPVENLFSSIRSSLTNRDSACATASVKYNSSLGYPETFSVADEKEGLADAFGGFVISDFSTLPPTPQPSNP